MEKITSVTNNRIKDIVKLRDEKKFQIEEQAFFIEGLHMVDEAIKRNLVRSIFLEERMLDKIDASMNYECVLITDNVSNKIASTKTNQGIFAVCELATQKLNLDQNILLLDQIQDPGNMGTLIRSAASFNFQTVVASNHSVSFYNPKVLRSTQGNLFSVNLVNADLLTTINELKENDYIIIGTVLNTNCKSLSSITFDKKQKYALIIGNEANGISLELHDLIDINLNIEMNNDVKSLNAAIAGSIIMYNI
ncbi:TrmH family RNA methyltransferase [Mesoplasma melaleucae]|uniref:RNA methyltransferase, TrmH family n=1 Tax=Mesoplasma melaleucae TaxID=81459 RepID=A0A2K8NVS0_9MOLU|nr:RNA methyltransferase [Mesoplasma melaleucae]ATZ17844.1 RNA methyltransferase, TrmH family [Mesoplasma melaleucae]